MHYTHVCMVLILAASLVNLIKELCMSFQIIPWCWVTWLWPSYESLGAVLVKGIWHSSCWLYHDSINIISCWLYTAYLTILCLPIALAIKVDQASYVLYALVNCITCLGERQGRPLPFFGIKWEYVQADYMDTRSKREKQSTCKKILNQVFNMPWASASALSVTSLIPLSQSHDGSTIFVSFGSWG